MDIHTGKHTLRKNRNEFEVSNKKKWSRFNIVILSCMPKNLLLVLVSKEVLDTLSSNSSTKLEKFVVTKLLKKSWW